MSRILICEDDPQVCRLLTRVLEERGDDIVVTSTVLDCLVSVAERKPDLLLADLLLQGEDTLSLIRQMHADFYHLKIIAITGAGRTWAHAALQHGADHVLEKPFIMDALVELIQHLKPRTVLPVISEKIA